MQTRQIKSLLSPSYIWQINSTRGDDGLTCTSNPSLNPRAQGSREKDANRPADSTRIPMTVGSDRLRAPVQNLWRKQWQNQAHVGTRHAPTALPCSTRVRLRSAQKASPHGVPKSNVIAHVYSTIPAISSRHVSPFSSINLSFSLAV